MSLKIILMAMATSLAMSLGVKAEESKANQPYSANVGNKKVTSVKREVVPKFRGVPQDYGLSREELLDAAREAVPIVPTNPNLRAEIDLNEAQSGQLRL
jgi:hypothetical protein